MINKILDTLNNKQDLSYEQACSMMSMLMDGKVNLNDTKSILLALKDKGESVTEITACANVMREKCVGLKPSGDVLEVVGTGGDGADTFNISTVSAIVVASCGVKVAKHGNRSVSSKCGSADVLEKLGVKLEVSATRNLQILNELGICFLYAPKYHASMKNVAPARKELGVRTIFNILGPLANPAGANIQLCGVYDKSLVKPMASVLKNLNVKRGMVVHGSDGLDEITLTGDTSVCEITSDGELKEYTINPKDLGLELCKASDLVGGDPTVNAEIAMNILRGEKSPRRDIVVLNSAVCLYMASDNLTLCECVNKVNDAIDSSKALKKLQEFIKATNS